MGTLWKSERIRLRPIESRDFEPYFYSNEIRETDYSRLADTVDFELPEAKAKENFEKMIARFPSEDTGFWIIEDHNGNILGDVNTYNCKRRHGTFMFGIAIKKECWGKGYAREALKIIFRFYFRELRYQKVTSYVYSYNTLSQKLHEKLGFKEEGRLKRMVYTNGSYYDHIYYGLTKEEFDELDPVVEL